MVSVMEKVLGKKIGHGGRIPGTKPVPGAEIVYFSDEPKLDFDEQFDRLTTNIHPRHAQAGAVISESYCRLWLPDGALFHPILYPGDVDGWRKDIEISAKRHGLLLGRIDGEDFAVSDGRVIPLASCKVEFK